RAGLLEDEALRRRLDAQDQVGNAAAERLDGGRLVADPALLAQVLGSVVGGQLTHGAPGGSWVGAASRAAPNSPRSHTSYRPNGSNGSYGTWGPKGPPAPPAGPTAPPAAAARTP